MKKCRKCGIDKPLTTEYYHRNSSQSSGFQFHCKVCFAEYYQNNKEAIAKREAEYRQNNKETIAKTKAEYRQNNKEKIAKTKAKHYHDNKEKIAEYRQNNKETIAKREAKYYHDNKEKINKRAAVYRAQNKEKIAEWHAQNKEKKAEWRADRKAEQPGCVYQIKNSINNRFYIGQTTRGELRWKDHLKSLRGKYHRNPKLQADFDKLGEEVFKWSIIEEYPKDKDTLLLGEIKAIDKLLREGKELYNISLTIDQLKLLMESK